MSTPAALCASACLTLPHSAPTSRPEAWISSITSAGGVPSALAISFTFGCLRIISTCGPAVAAVQPSSSRAFSPSGSSGTPCSASSFFAKARCSAGIISRSLLLERAGVEVLALALVLAGDHDVDAVGLVADVVVDPLELDLELLGAEADGAEHAEAAGLADGDDDVAAVGEGEDRELDAESLAKLGLHGRPPGVTDSVPAK